MTMNTLARVRVSLFVPELLLRECVADTLRGAGAEVLSSDENAQTFMHHLLERRPDVALVDLRGYGRATSLLVETRARYPGIATVVLAARCEPSPEICYNEGAAAWMDSEHATTEVLVSTIREVSEGVRCFPMRSVPSQMRDPAPVSEPVFALLLTPRERQVLGHIGQGSDNLKIGALLGISERTVKCHVTGLYRKSGVENRSQLALLARELGLRPHESPRLQYI